MATAPAGWYPDPTHDNLPRYWNGEAWADFVAPVPDPVPAPPVVDPYAAPVVDPYAAPVADQYAAPVVDPYASPGATPPTFAAVAPFAGASPAAAPFAAPFAAPPRTPPPFDRGAYPAPNVSYSAYTSARGNAYLTKAMLFWYVVQCLTGAAYLYKVSMKKALQDAGLVTMTSAESTWYVVMNIFFGGAYLRKVPMKRALADAGLVTMTGAETAWYLLLCLDFGAGYFMKVPMKKALRDAGVVAMTGAESGWYLLQCVFFGAGYLAKVTPAKALSEVAWPEDHGQRAALPTTKWWYWLVAVALMLLGGYGMRSIATTTLENVVPNGTAIVGLSSAWTTLTTGLPSANQEVTATNPAIVAKGFRDEATLFTAFGESVRAITFPAADQADVNAVLTGDAHLIALLNRGAADPQGAAALGPQFTVASNDLTLYVQKLSVDIAQG